MSTRQGRSRTSTPSAKRSGLRTRRTRNTPANSSLAEPPVVSLPNSVTGMTKAYNSHEFGLSWDNDIEFHVAQNAIILRKLRGACQAEIAKKMGTSQSAVARIEAGDHNITLRKLKRLVSALSGRIRFAIEPEEVHFPQQRPWWQRLNLASPTAWALRAEAQRSDLGERLSGAIWGTNGDVITSAYAAIAQKELTINGQSA